MLKIYAPFLVIIRELRTDLLIHDKKESLLKMGYVQSHNYTKAPDSTNKITP
jgi:hypothetical protein